MNQDKSLAERIGLHRLADWARRSCHAMRSDLELADCRSLDVLLYCSDDLIVTGRGDLDPDRSGS